jgi:hypothetical protein
MPTDLPRAGVRPRHIVLVLVVGLVSALGALAVWRNVTDDPDGRLRFAPPPLEDPIEIEISEENAGLELDDGRDYVLRMPSRPLEVRGGLRVRGGRNVVLIGGEIHHPVWYEGAPARANRGLLLADQTGIVHIEGLLISGALSEGIDLSEPAARAVQLQNVRIEAVEGTRGSNHADVIQTWAGPRSLRIDGLSGSTNYQGLFLLPTQHAPLDGQIDIDLSRVDISASGTSGYLYWADAPDLAVEVTDVYAVPSGDEGREALLWWPSDQSTDPWRDVVIGVPPEGPHVPAGLAGTAYRSPGYR